MLSSPTFATIITTKSQANKVIDLHAPEACKDYIKHMINKHESITPGEKIIVADVFDIIREIKNQGVVYVNPDVLHNVTRYFKELLKKKDPEAQLDVKKKIPV